MNEATSAKNALSEHLFRTHAGKMLAVLSRKWGIEQLDALQDIVQDTFESALQHWKFGQGTASTGSLAHDRSQE
jgi:DNA-directed RNA polymerase specialized sigma24 family protein